MLSAVRMSSRIVFERRCAAVGRKSQFTNVFGSGSDAIGFERQFDAAQALIRRVSCALLFLFWNLRPGQGMTECKRTVCDFVDRKQKICYCVECMV